MGEEVVKSVKVAGLFKIEFDVQSGTGSVNSIHSLSPKCRNTVTITNISTNPKQVGVEVSLPNGVGSLKFSPGGASRSGWAKTSPGTIANKGTVTLHCPIERDTGPISYSEPIQLDRLLSGDGAPKPLKAVTTSRIPFQMAIDAV